MYIELLETPACHPKEGFSYKDSNVDGNVRLDKWIKDRPVLAENESAHETVDQHYK